MSNRLFCLDKDCTGCGACKQKCPKSAIDLLPNELGFLMAHIDEIACVNCGICNKTCPILNRNDPILNSNFEPIFYAARNKSLDILKVSSSGGAFSSIVEAFQPDYVFGVSFDSNFRAIHRSSSKNEISQFRGSKYVQSNTLNTFFEAQQFLKDGKKVLFSGTPCQIAGLKMFLKKDYSNLLTCDLVCEGVQSQIFFDRYISHLAKNGDTIANISFRNKDYHGWERSDFVVEFESGKRIIETSQTRDTFYMNSGMFLGGFRDSCYECKFDKIPRQGDFTIGDLWGWRNIVPNWNDNKGISIIIINTQKGLTLLDELGRTTDMQEITKADAIKSNPNIYKSSSRPKNRNNYLYDLSKLSFDELVHKYHRPRSWARKLASKIKFKLLKK